MLDPKIIKEKPQIIKNMLKARAVDFDLDGLIESDQKRREFIIKTDEVKKKEKSSCTRNCSKKESRRRCNQFLDEMKTVSAELAKLEIRTRRD